MDFCFLSPVAAPLFSISFLSSGHSLRDKVANEVQYTLERVPLKFQDLGRDFVIFHNA